MFFGLLPDRELVYRHFSVSFLPGYPSCYQHSAIYRFIVKRFQLFRLITQTQARTRQKYRSSSQLCEKSIYNLYQDPIFSSIFHFDNLLPMDYSIDMRYEIEKTQVFDRWLAGLKDRQAVLAITSRLDRAVLGNLGDTRPVGGGVHEMRIFSGPGYRLYYTIRSGVIIVLLIGGDKSSQERDIDKAKKLAADM